MKKVLSDYIMEAVAADDAFEAAIKAAGFKSRWDRSFTEMPEYQAKIAADRAASEAWERSRR
jgi:hypothetical protein